MSKKRKNVQEIIFYGLLAAIILIAIMAALANQIAPHDPLAVDYSRILQKPSGAYPFGTDNMGRCVLSRVIYGLRSSVAMALLITLISFTIGTFLGMVSGYYGRVVDTLIMRITDTLLAFPGLVICIAIVGVMGAGWKNVVIALAISGWVEYARVSRGMVLSLREKEFIKAARTSGCGRVRIMIVHILPNIFQQLLVIATFNIGYLILTFAGLAILGLGEQPPAPELGLMLSESKQFLQLAPWLMVYPGLVMFLVVMLFSLFGDCLRDRMNQKTSQ